MGVKVQYHPDILKRMIAEGHEIGNHVWNHPVLSKMTLEGVHKQIMDTAYAISNATNYFPKTMRPPYGNTNNGLNKYLEQTEKLTVVLWSLDTLDWKRPKPSEIVKQVLSRVKPGTIILCHDVHPGTVEAVPVFVDELQKQGYTFLTVSEMLKRAAPG
jgi:peptidoglycan/xylan/chitin deacetylase (PgdA/CDA1 family)